MLFTAFSLARRSTIHSDGIRGLGFNAVKDCRRVRLHLEICLGMSSGFGVY